MSGLFIIFQDISKAGSVTKTLFLLFMIVKMVLGLDSLADPDFLPILETFEDETAELNIVVDIIIKIETLENNP